jgi:uncharacterized protein YhaN
MNARILSTLQARLTAKDRRIVELTQQVARLERERDQLRVALQVYDPAEPIEKEGVEVPV